MTYVRLTLLLSLILISCSRQAQDALTVVSPLPEGTLARDAAISIAFSRAVVPAESVGVWTATQFIQFEPSIPGRFTWQDTARLIFSPDLPFAGDTKFTGHLNTSLLKQMSKASSFDGTEEFSFTTESFRLKSAEFFYDRIGEQRQVGIKANLEFTYAVKPEEIPAHIRLTIDGQQIQPGKIATTEASRIIALEIATVTQLEKSRTVGVSFDDQLVSPETGTRIRSEEPITFTLPPLAELAIYGHEFGFDGTTSWIRVRTSQPVDQAAVKQYVTLNPARDFQVETEDQSFTLKGAFEPGTSFTLLIKEGMPSLFGGKTRHEYSGDIIIGNVQPTFSFASPSGIYMLLGGAKAVDVKTVNVPKLTVRVSQVFQNNLVFFLDQGRYYDYDYGYEYDEEEGGGSSYQRKYRYVLGNFGRQLDFDTLTISPVMNREVTTPLDMAPYLNNGYKGFFLIEVANLAEQWRTTSKLVVVSNIGLIVKRGIHELLVFATSLESNEPLRGVTVSLISTNNQTIATEKTDGDGVARFTNYQQGKEDLPLKLVTAELENDFTFINLDDYRVETSRFDVGGKRETDQLYDAMLYGDRNIYRPGEKIVVSGVVRSLTNPMPTGMPVRLKLINARGNTVSETQHMLNDEGAFESSYQTQPTAPTGEYRYELYTGNFAFLASYKVSVEDFVPDRLRIMLDVSQQSARPGDQLRYGLEALNFFGPPAADRNWQFTGSLEFLPFTSKAFPDYRFSDDASQFARTEPLMTEGKTDAQGKATTLFPLPASISSPGMVRAKGMVAVFDESGRPVYQIASTVVHPKDYYIGVKNLGAYYVSPNTPQRMQIVAVDVNDRPVSGFKAKIDLIRYEWHSVLRQHPGTQTLRYVSERREVPVKTDRVTITGKPLDYTYMVQRSGDYSIRVSKDGGSGYNQVNFYAYSWGTTDVTSFAVDPEARVDIVLDKQLYTPGEKARVLFQTPFDGTMLVTVERNKVFSYKYLTAVNNAASMDLAIEDKYLPNVYISAVLFRKVKELSMPLMAGHGFAPLMVEKKSNKLEVAITAPERIRPKTRQNVTVSVGGESSVAVTLAAVDEGICQVKNYKTPDPYGYFYQRKALELETFDFFKHLLPEPVKKGGSSTGGSDAELAQRANPITARRFVPVALWSGILKTNGGGKVEVPLDIPEFSGELRLMAFAYKGDRFGSAQRAMKVSDPVVMTPALPRFLAPGDSAVMAITAFNTTSSPVSLDFDVTATGGLTVRPASTSLDVDANRERYAAVGVTAGAAVGKATVTVKSEAAGVTLESTTELPVRPVAPFSADQIAGFVDGGQGATHDISADYLPYGRRSYVVLSPYPVANFARELKHLIGYPHGCLEQIVSKSFPQIYLRDVAMLMAPSVLGSGSPTYYVNEGISLVTALQSYDGSFMYWPGSSTNPWATVYATHFLLEAKKAGYAVPEATLKSAIQAVATVARSRKTEDYYYYDRQRVLVRRIADKSAVYALYVLAVAGAPEKALMDFYRGDRSLLTNDTRTLLAGAYALSGDRRSFSDLMPGQFTIEDPARTTGGWFDSPIRANAIILNVLLETDLNNPAIPRYMQYLSDRYKANAWYSTQDDAFTLIAFGKAARQASATHLEGSVSVGDKKYAYKGGNQKIDVEPFGKKVSLTMNGAGRVYYTIVTEGIRSDGAVRLEDKNLQVRRELLNRSGAPVNPASVRQNDLVVVRLTLTSAVEHLENVAITDLLPAGFEIENPRLTEMTQYPFIKNPSQPEYMDIRDDRINIYTSFRGQRQQVFYYAVRAVTPGTFQYPPVVAEAMYDATYYSANGKGTLRVAK